MDDFADHVDAWNNFFMLAGSASATLIGPLFVAVSLRDDIRALDDSSIVRTTTGHSFQSYVSVLLFAFYFLIPESTPETIGWPIIITAAVALLAIARSTSRHRNELVGSTRVLMWQFVVPSICYLAAIGVGIGLFWQDEEGISWFVSVIAFLLIIPTRNAWHMLLSPAAPSA